MCLQLVFEEISAIGKAKTNAQASQENICFANFLNENERLDVATQYLYVRLGASNGRGKQLDSRTEGDRS